MKKLFDELQEISNNKRVFEQIINKLKRSAMRGDIFLRIKNHKRCIDVFRILGYTITESDTGYTISWENEYYEPEIEGIDFSGYLPRDIRELHNKYTKIRNFMEDFEREAKIAAAFGRRTYEKPLPDDIDQKLMREYLDQVYDDVDVTTEEPIVVFIDWDGIQENECEFI